MLAVGDRAPEIFALTTKGERFRLSENAGSLCTVLFFFPKAFTPGCTLETRSFGASYNELSIAGASLIGVSNDDHETQCRFAGSLDVRFPMIGDPSGAIARSYDVRWPILGIAKRVTYVISPGQVVLGVFHHEIRIERHKDDVLRMVEALHRQKRAEGGEP